MILSMEEWLQGVARHVGLAIEGVAVLVIALGSIEALVRVGMSLATGAKIAQGRLIWMRYAHWLVAALTFQLAADVVNTTITPDWSDIGHVAAIAAIRSFLAYFLERDIEQVSKNESLKT